MKIEELNHRNQLGKFISLKGYKVGLEIGVREGLNAFQLLNSSTLTKLYLIDPWTVNRVKGMTNNRNGDQVMSEAVNRLDQFNDRIVMIRAMSQDVSHLFTDGFFDFIHIDGAHTYPWVTKDIELYWSKIRSGGLFTGHDYSKLPQHTGHVDFAVDEFVEREKLELFVTGERLPTWMVYKP